MMPITEHENCVRAVHETLDELRDEVRRLRDENNYLKQRVSYFDQLLDRCSQRQKTANTELCRRVEELEEGASHNWEMAPRQLLYALNSVVREVVIQLYPDAEDRPLDFHEIESIHEGVERWGASYVCF